MKSFGFILLVLIFSITSCKSYRYAETSYLNGNLTVGYVKKNIIKGKTEQSEIIQMFGSPNLISKNKSNDEVWDYNRMNTNSKKSNSDFFDGERASESSSTNSFDLLIIFDNNDTVKDYSIVSTSY